GFDEHLPAVLKTRCITLGSNAWSNSAFFVAHAWSACNPQTPITLSHKSFRLPDARKKHIDDIYLESNKSLRPLENHPRSETINQNSLVLSSSVLQASKSSVSRIRHCQCHATKYLH